jgi:hypothetical protein
MMIIPNNILLIVGVNADGFMKSIQYIKAIEKSFHSSSSLIPNFIFTYRYNPTPEGLGYAVGSIPYQFYSTSTRESHY